MSKKLEVSSGELLGLLRYCQNGGPCAECKLKNMMDCHGALMYRAADEIERLTKELKGATASKKQGVE